MIFNSVIQCRVMSMSALPSLVFLCLLLRCSQRWRGGRSAACLSNAMVVPLLHTLQHNTMLSLGGSMRYQGAGFFFTGET